MFFLKEGAQGEWGTLWQPDALWGSCTPISPFFVDKSRSFKGEGIRDFKYPVCVHNPYPSFRKISLIVQWLSSTQVTEVLYFSCGSKVLNVIGRFVNAIDKLFFRSNAGSYTHEFPRCRKMNESEGNLLPIFFE